MRAVVDRGRLPCGHSLPWRTSLPPISTAHPPRCLKTNRIAWSTWSEVVKWLRTNRYCAVGRLLETAAASSLLTGRRFYPHRCQVPSRFHAWETTQTPDLYRNLGRCNISSSHCYAVFRNQGLSSVSSSSRSDSVKSLQNECVSASTSE